MARPPTTPEAALDAARAERERRAEAAAAAESHLADLVAQDLAAREAYRAAPSDATWAPIDALRPQVDRAQSDMEIATERLQSAADAERAAEIPVLTAKRDIAKDAASLSTLTDNLLPHIENLVSLESQLCDTAIAIVEHIQHQHDALAVVDDLTKALGEPVMATAFRTPEQQPADVELIQRFVSVAIAQARNARRRVHTPDASQLIRYISPPSDRSNKTEIDRWRQAEAALQAARTRASKDAA